MPDPTFKIDGATVLSKSGTTVSVDSSVTVPASIGGSLVLVSTSSGTDVSELKFENTFRQNFILNLLILFAFLCSSGLL